MPFKLAPVTNVKPHKLCECEHTSHFRNGEFAHTEHVYGQNFPELYEVPTTRGIFLMCSGCAADAEKAGNVLKSETEK